MTHISNERSHFDRQETAAGTFTLHRLREIQSLTDSLVSLAELVDKDGLAMERQWSLLEINLKDWSDPDFKLPSKGIWRQDSDLEAGGSAVFKINLPKEASWEERLCLVEEGLSAFGLKIAELCRVLDRFCKDQGVKTPSVLSEALAGVSFSCKGLLSAARLEGFHTDLAIAEEQIRNRVFLNRMQEELPRFRDGMRTVMEKVAKGWNDIGAELAKAALAELSATGGDLRNVHSALAQAISLFETREPLSAADHFAAAARRLCLAVDGEIALCAGQLGSLLRLANLEVVSEGALGDRNCALRAEAYQRLIELAKRPAFPAGFQADKLCRAVRELFLRRLELYESMAATPRGEALESRESAALLVPGLIAGGEEGIKRAMLLLGVEEGAVRRDFLADGLIALAEAVQRQSLSPELRKAAFEFALANAEFGSQVLIYALRLAWALDAKDPRFERVLTRLKKEAVAQGRPDLQAALDELHEI